MTSRLCALLLAALPFVCAVPALEPRANKDDLTREWAEFRRTQVASVAYDLRFTLRKDAETFEGRATLDVTLHKADVPLSVDLKAQSIDGVYVDGKQVHGLVTRDGSFDIPASYLHSGPLKIEVAYTGFYSNTRDGLCHYTDPVDDREYLHTNLEPYGAHYVFPCFDQPDIKATYRLTVEAPASWEVIGNSLPEQETVQGKVKTTHFKTTPLLSTYLFFLGGGDYRVWHDEHNGLPLVLYARDSLAEYFDHERLFAETKSGLDYFNEYFGTPYPFDKYAHVFAPELGPGAMENPGAVTMNEFMIFRGDTTTDRYRNRNNTLLHEMAHMWFGDLVTMAWWNDLWLNESFATFSAYQAQEALGEYTGIWDRFYEGKIWAYHHDQFSTTHPIEVAVPSAQLAIANFDAITYAKGASALKQLWFTVGAEAYRRGVVDYFQHYAWKNATRAQFLASIDRHTEVDLGVWSERWIQTAGLSAISVEYICENGEIGEAAIKQRAINAPVLSPHQTQIGLFRFNDAGKLSLYETLSVPYDAPRRAIPELSGKPCPEFLYPNYGDMDYGLFFLDPKSVATARKHIHAIEEPMVRRMTWGTLHSMVRHQKLRASDLMSLIIEKLPRETDTGMLEFLLGARPTQEVFVTFLPHAKRLAYAPQLSQLFWDGLQTAPPGSDARLLWLDTYVDTVSLPGEEERLRTLLASGVGGKALDQPRRWQVIRSLATIGAPGIEALVATELKRDATDQGTRNAFNIRGAIPTLEAKRAQWERLTDPSLSYALLRSGSATFFNRLHPELVDAFVDDWFDYVAAQDWEADQHRISVWFGRLMPRVFTQEFLDRSRAALDRHAGLPARARRAWQESNDIIERVVAIHAHEESTS